MSKTETEKALSYLELFKISDYKYIIGIFESGITFYKQQIRSLNIFDALKKTGRIPDNDRGFTIAVIGGGVAGLTFAAAALKSRINVHLFEEGPKTLHIQDGCTIRDIHPNLYDWPAENSLETHTSLPVLNWQNATAEKVVNTVRSEFKSITTEIKKKKRNNYTEYCDVKDIVIAERNQSKKFEIEGTMSRHGGDEKVMVLADLVIYAIGYGVEIGVTATLGRTESYWRNTSIKQDDLSKASYLISGTGDGALIDLFNVLIWKFSYNSFFEILDSNPLGKKLRRYLKDIREKRVKTKNLRDDFYKEEFAKISNDEFKYILEEYGKRGLLTKLDPTVKIYLFGRRTKFYDILLYKKISLLNAFIAYILYNSTKFEYQQFLDYKKPSFNNKLIRGEKKFINREGTNIEALLTKSKFTTDERDILERLRGLQGNSAEHGIVTPTWAKDAFDIYFKEKKKLTHHLSNETKAMCSIFINLLGSSLADYYQNKKDIRVTMHRVLNMNNNLFYQMVTPYFQNFNNRKNDKVKVIYDIRNGNVGHTISTGVPLWTKNANSESFKQLMTDFGIEKSYHAKIAPKTILTIPIIAKYKGHKNDGNKTYNSCNAVIYLDSTDENFFDNDEVQNMIIRLCENFIGTLDLSISNEDLKMEAFDYEPVKITKVEELKNDCIMPLKAFEYLLFDTHPLELSLFSSLEIIPM